MTSCKNPFGKLKPKRAQAVAKSDTGGPRVEAWIIGAGKFGTFIDRFRDAVGNWPTVATAYGSYRMSRWPLDTPHCSPITQKAQTHLGVCQSKLYEDSKLRSFIDSSQPLPQHMVHPHVKMAVGYGTLFQLKLTWACARVNFMRTVNSEVLSTGSEMLLGTGQPLPQHMVHPHANLAVGFAPLLTDDATKS
ncbi:hypothetical protein EMPG_12802 [Blastomyces silverae]|uniref:Uncharacterized protein n=1 Tax=Blastomyces silverae TaxID=2060906 RepID=A0A0H1BSF8_9EURO|nr:hypothetical protein EMPG_12802 [Blastomyces silverae]